MGDDSFFRQFFLGFVKVHILHHANQEPVYGLFLIEELGRHGYRLSPGTLYPILHQLEAGGYLSRMESLVEGKVRKYYTTTDKGRRALEEAMPRIRQLVSEVLQAAETAGPDSGDAGHAR